MTWEEWSEIFHIPFLRPGAVKINVAEFLAALITCETFAAFCSKKFTTIEIDSRVAKSWLDTARCPKYPFDRCAQGVHLHLIKNSIKLRTAWVPSGDNDLADKFSRYRFSANPSGHMVGECRMLKIKPKRCFFLRFGHPFLCSSRHSKKMRLLAPEWLSFLRLALFNENWNMRTGAVIWSRVARLCQPHGNNVDCS